MSLHSILAFDVGEKRIGVAIANAAARLPRPLCTLSRDENIVHDIVALVAEQRAVTLVFGLPRGLDGQETAQTRTTQKFVAQLTEHIKVPLHWQDEAVTSVQAEAELKQRGKPYVKGDIDALAATYILEDFLHQHPEEIA